MSYHLAMRSLQLCNREPMVGTFSDCIEHSLSGEHPASSLHLEMQRPENQKLSFLSVADRLGELLAVDLNPLGHVLRFATKDTTYRRTWDFFNGQGNVVSKVTYDGSRYHAKAVCKEFESLWADSNNAVISDSHEKILSGYHDVLMKQLKGNQNATVRGHKLEDSRVSAMARILGAGQLVIDLSEFFEEFPTVNVGKACQNLGIHPRHVERQMQTLGTTAVKIKRACMLSKATREILRGHRSLAETATSCGYAHGAHLTHAVLHATGGMSPSFIRSLMSA